MLPLSDDISPYLLDHYGTCKRGPDCYWGKDAQGKFDGCLRVGWKGRMCAHWTPSGAKTLEELRSLIHD